MVELKLHKMRPLRKSETSRGVAVAAPLISEGTTAPIPDVQEAKEAGSFPANEVNHSNFAPNEIAATDGVETVPPSISTLINAGTFEDDLQRAARHSKEMFYVGWREKLKEYLSHAYTLYLHVLLDQKKMERLLEDPYFLKTRRRALSKNKEALAAVQYVTKPETEDDRKSASACANMLIYARYKGFTANQFSASMTGVTLLKATAFVRGLRRENVMTREAAPAKPMLTLIFNDGGKPHRCEFTDISILTEAEQQHLAQRIVEALQEVHATTA